MSTRLGDVLSQQEREGGAPIHPRPKDFRRAVAVQDTPFREEVLDHHILTFGIEPYLVDEVLLLHADLGAARHLVCVLLKFVEQRDEDGKSLYSRK